VGSILDFGLWFLILGWSDEVMYLIDNPSKWIHPGGLLGANCSLPTAFCQLANCLLPTAFCL
jgi:hypothetical protein